MEKFRDTQKKLKNMISFSDLTLHIDVDTDLQPLIFKDLRSTTFLKQFLLIPSFYPPPPPPR